MSPQSGEGREEAIERRCSYCAQTFSLSIEDAARIPEGSVLSACGSCLEFRMLGAGEVAELIAAVESGAPLD